MNCKDCIFYYTDEHYCTFFKANYNPTEIICKYFKQGKFNERFYVKSMPLIISTGFYYLLIDREQELGTNLDTYLEFDYEEEADKLCKFLNKMNNRLLRLQKIYNETYYENQIEKEYWGKHTPITD